MGVLAELEQWMEAPSPAGRNWNATPEQAALIARRQQLGRENWMYALPALAPVLVPAALEAPGAAIGVAARGAARGGLGHLIRYDVRLRKRAVEDPVGHNFPRSYDRHILKTKPIRQRDGSLLYRREGAIGDTDGAYEIAVNPRKMKIVHRHFRAAKKKR
jgi:hypothetical protein